MRILAVLLLAGSACQPAFAQEYAPPDKELWDAMQKAMAEISMPLSAHQQWQAIMSNIQREAAIRAARAKAMQPQRKED